MMFTGRNRVLFGGGSPLQRLIRSLFGAGEQGALYDPSDLSMLYQDATGATPVTASGQPVGLMLDKRLGLALGSDLLAGKGSPFSSIADWPITLGAGGTRALNGAALTVTSVGATTVAGRGITTGAGGYYLFTYTLANITTTSARLLVSNVAGDGAIYISPSQTAGTYQERLLLAAATTYQFELNVVTAGSADFSICTTKFFAGNHASQATAASRTVYTVASGLSSVASDGVDDSLASTTGGGGSAGFFVSMAVNPSGGAGTVRLLLDDHVGFSGYEVGLDAADKLFLAAGNAAAFTQATTAGAATVGTGYVLTAWDDGVNLNAQINNGAVASVARPAVAAGGAPLVLFKNAASAANFFTGSTYGMIYRKDSGLTATQRSQVKTFLGNKIGLSL